MSDVWSLRRYVWALRRSPEGTRRVWRQRQVLQVILRGEYGPRWWEVAPAFAGLGLAIGLPLACVSWLWVRVGWWAALPAATTVVVVGARAAVLRHRKAAVRHRQHAVRFTLDDVDAADDRAFRRIVGRLLLRDGWVNVRGVRVTDAGVVHLVGIGPDGCQLGCAVERGGKLPGGPGEGRAALRPVGSTPPRGPTDSPGARPPLFVVVSSGAFSRERVVWAARNGVRLVDREMLRRWATGEDLVALLGLGLGDVAERDAS
ncbi:hypothetical protein [Streptomyces sp. NPDC059513]|uniref:hypothetical protein n=1 Tax=unclassified Streptomyces TaxID=2593676 RepID=UPI0036A3D2A4